MSEATASPPSIKIIAWFIGTLAAFAFFALIAAYSSRMTHDYSDYDQQRAVERYATLDKLRDAERQTLTTADWVDQGKKIIRIPIDEAMAREIDTLKSEPAQIGCEIPVVAPPPAAVAAPSTNAAPAAPAPPAKPNK